MPSLSLVEDDGPQLGDVDTSRLQAMARRTTAASSVGATQTSEALIKNFLDVF